MRILLSSPIKPYPGFKNGRDNLHVNYANTTYGQDIFSIPTRMHFYGLHLIAQNIHEPVTVLENPTRHAFIREIQAGYDIVGITFVLPFFSKVLEMARIVRTFSPRSKIILGGPGVQCFSHATGKETDLLQLADSVCWGDGVAFMRRLLGENTQTAVRQLLPLGAVIPLNFRSLQQESATLISTLGCTNSCEFCAASAFFRHRRTEIATPRELYHAVLEYLQRYPINSARILDDNFLVDKNYVRQFGELIMDDPLCQQRGFTYSTFANFAAVSQYNFADLARWGLAGILIGIESKFVEHLPPHVRRKLHGIDTVGTIQSLLDHGIFVEGSLILGWDFHDKQTIVTDIDHYVSLGTTFDQIVPLVPAPETRLWKQLKEEGRLFDRISWDDTGFYVKWHQFKHLTHEEVWNFEDMALRKCYETWGPSFLRLMDVHIRGYRTFKHSSDPSLRRVAQRHKNDCFTLYPTLLCSRVFAPSEQVKRRTLIVEEAFHQEFGRPPFNETLNSWSVALLAGYRKLQRTLVKEDTVQPRFMRYRYNGSAQHA